MDLLYQQFNLTPREFDLLSLLATHAGSAFSYDGADRTVDSHLAQVRRKLGAEGAHRYGVGRRVSLEERYITLRVTA